MQILREISRYFVGGLFIFSGLIKVNDPAGTAIKLTEYFEVFSSDFGSFFLLFVPAAMFLSVFLSVLEVVLGVALLINYRIKWTSWILLIIIVFFTFLTFYSAYFNKVTDCGCFGDAIKLTPWESFTKDIILVFFIGIIFWQKDAYGAAARIPKSDLVISIVTLFHIGISIYAIEHLPFIDFRAYKVGNHIPSLMEPSEEYQYKYILEKDGKTVELDKYPTDPGYTFKEMVLLNPGAQPKISDYSIFNDEGDFTEASFTGNKVLVVFHDARKARTKKLADLSKMIADLDNTDIEVMILTSTDGEYFEQFRHENQLAAPFYYADATVLKTMIRSNPGITAWRDGKVLAKWHINDVPHAVEVKSHYK
jgi:uncharacterized membrane protein YphA (DoxX/SURF4 family)